jgi:hypothetical protein
MRPQIYADRLKTWAGWQKLTAKERGSLPLPQPRPPDRAQGHPSGSEGY